MITFYCDDKSRIKWLYARVAVDPADRGLLTLAELRDYEDRQDDLENEFNDWS